MDKYKKIDILAIGDTAIDVFVKINDAEANCDLEGEHCKLCLSFGGKISYESATVCYAVGNSANAAVSTSRLGLKSALMSNIGDDDNGDKCLEVLKNENVDTFAIKIQKDKPTNYHYVLWYGSERTILVKHEKYDYEWTKTKENEDEYAPSWVYLSSLGENSLRFHNEIIDYLKRHVNVKLAFSPGTFQIKLGHESLKEIYERTDVFLCNKEEAEKILGIEEKDIPKLTKMIYALGPKIVVVTDGVNGCYSYDGQETYFMGSLPHDTFESTGAGDAFSSTFVSALSLGKSIKEALLWGAINGRSVVQHIGPQKGLLTREQLEETLKTITEDYQPTKVE